MSVQIFPMHGQSTYFQKIVFYLIELRDLDFGTALSFRMWICSLRQSWDLREVFGRQRKL
jgi:hypothetical protein